MKLIHFNDNQDIKEFIIVFLKKQLSTCPDIQEIWDYINDPKTVFNLDSCTQKTKEIVLGQAPIPFIGSSEIINNEFWDFQDLECKKLYPELTDSIKNFEFLIVTVQNVKYNLKSEKIEIIEERFKFSTPK